MADKFVSVDDDVFIQDNKLNIRKLLLKLGLNQLKDYLDILNLNSGYLIVFNFNKNKQYLSNWVEVQGKMIYEVIL